MYGFVAFIPLHNWAGSGFAVYAIIMVAALIASMFLLLERREEKNPEIKAGVFELIL